MRTVVFGYHTMGCAGFDALLRHGFEVATVLTHDDDPREEIWWESLAERAHARNIPVHVRERGDPALAALVAACRPDFLFSFYYRQLIPTEVLRLARRGALNLHGSLLPRYRGRAPVNWVLVRGETETGVSLHHMEARADAGPLVDQERVPIAPEDTAYTLYLRLVTAAGRLLDRALPALAAGTARARPLDLAAGSYFGRRTPEDGRIDWGASAADVYNLVRGVTHPYPGAFTWFRGHRVVVWWAHPGEPTDRSDEPGTILAVGREGIDVATGSGAVRVVTVQAEGEPELPASAFALASGAVPGERFL